MFVPDKYLQYFDLDEKDIINRTIYDLKIPVISEEILFPLIDNSIENGERETKEITYTYNNKNYYFFIKFVPLVLESGEHGLILIIKDFTEEKRIKDTLIEQIIL